MNSKNFQRPPLWQYVARLLVGYLLVSLSVGVLFVFGVAFVAHTVDTLCFLAGIVAAIATRRALPALAPLTNWRSIWTRSAA